MLWLQFLRETPMPDFITHISWSDWLAIGVLLLILEIFGAGGYLLCIGSAAVLMGGLSFLLPLPWMLQYLLFAVLSVATGVLWWKRQHREVRETPDSGLNQRGRELLGREFELIEPIVDGRGRIRAGDSIWLVSGPELPAGSSVRVIGQEGTVLKVITLD